MSNQSKATTSPYLLKNPSPPNIVPSPFDDAPNLPGNSLTLSFLIPTDRSRLLHPFRPNFSRALPRERPPLPLLNRNLNTKPCNPNLFIMPPLQHLSRGALHPTSHKLQHTSTTLEEKVQRPHQNAPSTPNQEAMLLPIQKRTSKEVVYPIVKACPECFPSFPEPASEAGDDG